MGQRIRFFFFFFVSSADQSERKAYTDVVAKRVVLRVTRETMSNTFCLYPHAYSTP